MVIEEHSVSWGIPVPRDWLSLRHIVRVRLNDNQTCQMMVAMFSCYRESRASLTGDITLTADPRIQAAIKSFLNNHAYMLSLPDKDDASASDSGSDGDDDAEESSQKLVDLHHSRVRESFEISRRRLPPVTLGRGS